MLVRNFFPILLEYKREITVRDPNLQKKIIDNEIAGHKAAYRNLYQQEHNPFLFAFFQFLKANNLPPHREILGQPDRVQKAWAKEIIVRDFTGDLLQKWSKHLADSPQTLKLTNIYGDYDPYSTAMLNYIMYPLEVADPTFNREKQTGGQYIPWLVREWASGRIQRIEDLGNISYNLEIYDKNKKLRGFPPEARDIMRLQVGQLRDIVKSFDPNDPGNLRKNMGKYDIISGNINVQLDEYGVPSVTQSGDLIVIPRDIDAAIWWSVFYRGEAEWCTAYIPPRENRFESYNEKGPLYILIPETQQHDGEKYQLHFSQHYGLFEDAQFKDERDKDINIYGLIKRFPNFKSVLSKYSDLSKNYIPFVNDQVLEQLLKVISSNFLLEVEEWASDKEKTDYDWHNIIHNVAEKGGYLDQFGNIEWKKYRNDPNYSLMDYIEFDQDVYNVYDTVKTITDMNAAEFRNNITRPESNNLNELPYLMYNQIDENIGQGYKWLKTSLQEVKRSFNIYHAPDVKQLTAMNKNIYGRDVIVDPETKWVYAIVKTQR